MHGKSPPGLSCSVTNYSLAKDKGVLCWRIKESCDSEPHIQVLIPTDLRPLILKQLQDHAGHMGVKHTMEKV